MRPLPQHDDSVDGQRESVPAGTPSWISRELIERTIRVWQPYYAALLSPEDAVTMILNVGRLFTVVSQGQGP